MSVHMRSDPQVFTHAASAVSRVAEAAKDGSGIVPVQPMTPVAAAQEAVQRAAPLAQFAANAANPAGATVTDTRALALQSADVHRTSENPPAGFRAATPIELGALGLKPQDLTLTQNAITMRVFVAGAGADAKYVAAFSIQGEANNAQYGLIRTVGQQLAQTANVRVTVGGQAFSLGRSAPSTTGSSLPAPSLASIAKASAVSAFHIKGEVLSALQSGGNRVVPGLAGRTG
jgi:hypothetical protein